MNMNSTCVQENGHDTCFAPKTSAGLAVGLSLFFIFLAIIIGVIAFIYRNKIGTLVRTLQRRGQKMEVCAESPQADDNQYTGMTREQPQTPIYENFQNQKAPFKRPVEEQSRETAQSEEDLYVQCDSVDEGIYSNDPEFNSKRPDPQEEDVYLMPES